MIYVIGLIFIKMIKQFLSNVKSDIVLYAYSKQILEQYKDLNVNVKLLDFIDKLKLNISEDFLNILSEKIENLNNPIFVFYLYDLYATKDKSIEIKQRELDIIDFLIKRENYVIVCTENKIRQYNWRTIDTTPIK